LHVPVLLEEVINYLNCDSGKVIIDCTVGLGGHAEKILEAIQPDGFLWGIDQDDRALEIAYEKLREYKNFKLIKGNFGDLEYLSQEYLIKNVDGILFDLGVSSIQLDEENRGFTYQKDAPLDMRMDKSLKTTARSLVNRLTEKELTWIIRVYGEENWANRIAKFIVNERLKKEIATTGELVDIIKAAIPARARRKGGHPARRTFQALRIAVNRELDNLEFGLKASLKILRAGGKLCIISFHSLEDRIVKQFLRNNARGCICPPGLPVCACGCKPKIKIITRKPVVPHQEEIKSNPRARSSKLRVGEKIN